VATSRALLICQSAMFHDTGLFSALGVGITSFSVPDLPAAVGFGVISVVRWAEAEAGQTHVLGLRISQGSETVARLSAGAEAGSWDELEPPNYTWLVSVTFDARREGLYRIELTADGDVIDTGQLVVRSRMPSV
jgi:hypothetical protein